MVGDWDDRMAKMLMFVENLVKDGVLEGVHLELCPYRSAKSAFMSATASAPTAFTVYSVPTGKEIMTKNVTITSREAAAVTVKVYDDTTQLDELRINALESAVLPKEYKCSTSLKFTQDAYTSGVTMAADFIEYPEDNKSRTPPS